MSNTRKTDTENKKIQGQKESLAELNDSFPLPNPSSDDIKKTFAEMGRTLTEERTKNDKIPQVSSKPSVPSK